MMSDFKEIMVDAVDKALLALGESVRSVIYFHMEKRFGIKREEIPDRLSIFHKALENLLGPGVKVVEVMIAERLFVGLGMRYEKHEGWTLVDYAEDAKKGVGAR